MSDDDEKNTIVASPSCPYEEQWSLRKQVERLQEEVDRLRTKEDVLREIYAVAKRQGNAKMGEVACDILGRLQREYARLDDPVIASAAFGGVIMVWQAGEKSLFINVYDCGLLSMTYMDTKHGLVQTRCAEHFNVDEMIRSTLDYACDFVREEEKEKQV